MRKPGGHAIWFGTDQVRECDTFTCAHCGKVKHVPPKQRPEDLGGLCKQCMSLICAKCVATGNCDPFEEKLKRQEARMDARRSYEEAMR